MTDSQSIKALFGLIATFPQSEIELLKECGIHVAKKFIEKAHPQYGLRSLPDINDLIAVASENLVARGITVENLYIYANAVALAWTELDWLNPLEYYSEQQIEWIFMNIFKASCNEDDYLFVSHAEAKNERGMTYVGSEKIVLLQKIKDDRISLEIYPYQFTHFATLHKKDGGDHFFVEDAFSLPVRLSYGDNGKLKELGISYFDEDGRNPLEYVYQIRSIQDSSLLCSGIHQLTHLWRTTLQEKKPEAESIFRYLSDNGIDCFYHFTDIRNLPSIHQYGGLLSREYLQDHRIVVPHMGGNMTSWQLDHRNMHQDYIHLSFGKMNPMLGAKQRESPDSQFVWLKINPEMALMSQTIFCNKNANKNGRSEGLSLQDLKNVDIKATSMWHIPGTPEYDLQQAEIMCRTFIPLSMITNIDNPEPVS